MIKQHAQNIADHTGAYTVVPDLYKGKVGVNAEVRKSKIKKRATLTRHNRKLVI